MAYQFLKAQDVPALVSKVVMDARRGKVLADKQAAVTRCNLSEVALLLPCWKRPCRFPELIDCEGLAIVRYKAEMNQRIAIRRTRSDFLLTSMGLWQHWSGELWAGINLARWKRPLSINKR